MNMDNIIENFAVASARFYTEDGQKVGAVRFERPTPGTEKGQLIVTSITLVSGVGRISRAVLVLPKEGKSPPVSVAEAGSGDSAVLFVKSLDVTKENPLEVMPMMLTVGPSDPIRSAVGRALDKLQPIPTGVGVVLRARLPEVCEECGCRHSWKEDPRILKRFSALNGSIRSFGCKTEGCKHTEFLKDATTG